jgi:hypothetical protein
VGGLSQVPSNDSAVLDIGFVTAGQLSPRGLTISSGEDRMVVQLEDLLNLSWVSRIMVYYRSLLHCQMWVRIPRGLPSRLRDYRLKMTTIFTTKVAWASRIVVRLPLAFTQQSRVRFPGGLRLKANLGGTRGVNKQVMRPCQADHRGVERLPRPLACLWGTRIVAITSVFQTDEGSSILPYLSEHSDVDA